MISMHLEKDIICNIISYVLHCNIKSFQITIDELNCLNTNMAIVDTLEWKVIVGYYHFNNLAL